MTAACIDNIPGTRQSLLQLNAVTRDFQTKDGPVTALDRVSFSLADGEFLCVVGPSGCGKSTILSLVAGLDRPTSGSLLLDSVPITRPGADRGMVFQRDNLFPWLTVFQNVTFGLTLKANRKTLSKARRESLLDRASSLLDVVGLTGFKDRYPRELSGGMRQRAGLVRALVTQPRMLLMDEPFGALDAQTREEMQELLLTLCGRHRTTVLFITHDIEEAVLLGDRVLVMQAHPGKIIADIPISLPRPRNMEMRLESHFGAMRSEVASLLHHRERRRLSEDIWARIHD
jgi:NitT/TauT family transport system ATP-binding protein